MVIRTEFSTKIEASPRSSVREVYNLIKDDLQYAIDNGPRFIDHFYSGSLAAQALLAKVKLYTGEYAAAAVLAQGVIENGEGYALEANYATIFMEQFNSVEVIFAPFAGPGAEGGSGMDQIKNTSYSTYLQNLSDEQVGGPGDGSLDGAGSNYDPRFIFAYSETTKGVNNQGKYPYAPTTGSQNNTLYHLRMAEMYLVQAEALVRSGGDTGLALSQVNTIRQRSGLEPKIFVDHPTLLQDIRQEKLLELFFENGEPLYDLVRYHTLGNLEASSIKPSMTSENKFVLPIPAQALIGNNALVQNPGY